MNHLIGFYAELPTIFERNFLLNFHTIIGEILNYMTCYNS